MATYNLKFSVRVKVTTPLLRCGVCGRNMYGRSRVNKKDHYYQCSSKRIKGQSCGNRSINIDKIEGVVWSRFFKGDELLSFLKADIVKDENQIQDLEKSLDIHFKKLNSFQQDFERLISLSAKGVFTEEEIVKQKTNIEYNITQQGKYIEDYKKQISNAKNSQQLIDQYIQEFENYADDLSFIEKKEIFNKYIKDIIVTSWKSNINLYTLEFKFKISEKREIYVFDKKNGVLISLDNKEIILSKYTNLKTLEQFQRILKTDKHIIIEPTGEVRLIPILEVENEMGKILFNTIIPYGILSDWNKEKIINFYTENPEWLCSKSGLSIISIEESLETYKQTIDKFQKFKISQKPLADWLMSFEEMNLLT